MFSAEWMKARPPLASSTALRHPCLCGVAPTRVVVVGRFDEQFCERWGVVGGVRSRPTAEIAARRAKAHNPAMANSLDLDPEWGAIDLLEEVEETFGIKVANEDAERCSTVGDLYAVICAHSPEWDTQAGNCASSMVFYSIRRSLAPQDKAEVTPQTLLLSGPGSAFRLFKTLGRDTALRLPSPNLTWLGVIGGFMLVVGLIVAVVALLVGQWMASGAAVLMATLGIPLLRLDPGRLPMGIVTVGDLVRRTVPLNSETIKVAGGRPPDRWTILAALAAEHGVLPPDQISPDTFFHRKSLELATAR